MLSISSDEVIASYKLKDYLQECIDELTEQVFAFNREGYPDEYINLIIRHRNMLLCIKEICKARNKF